MEIKSLSDRPIDFYLKIKLSADDSPYLFLMGAAFYFDVIIGKFNLCLICLLGVAVLIVKVYMNMIVANV